MPSTHLSLHYHIIFSTKERYAFIHDEWRDRLHQYLGGCIRTAGGIPEAVGGTSDHVHLLAGLKATHCLADFVRDIKSNSSSWVKEENLYRLFSWQDGYGAFTVSSSLIGKVKDYIANQEEHHCRRSFQEEYRSILDLNKIDYNKEYLW